MWNHFSNSVCETAESVADRFTISRVSGVFCVQNMKWFYGINTTELYGKMSNLTVDQLIHLAQLLHYLEITSMK